MAASIWPLVDEVPPPPVKSPIEGEVLSGYKKGTGLQMFDTYGYIYQGTKHDKKGNVKRYKCKFAPCKVKLTTTYEGDIVLSVRGHWHNHESQKDLVAVKLVEDEERRKNFVENRQRFVGGQEMSENICNKVETDVQKKLVSSARSLSKMIAYDNMKKHQNEESSADELFPGQLCEAVLMDEEEDTSAAHETYDDDDDDDEEDSEEDEDPVVSSEEDEDPVISSEEDEDPVVSISSEEDEDPVVSSSSRYVPLVLEVSPPLYTLHLCTLSTTRLYTHTDHMQFVFLFWSCLSHRLSGGDSRRGGAAQRPSLPTTRRRKPSDRK